MRRMASGVAAVFFIVGGLSLLGEEAKGLPGISIATAGASGVTLLKFDPTLKRFREIRKDNYKSCLYVAADSQSIYAASDDTLCLWNTSLEQRKERKFGKIGSLASINGHVIVAADSCLFVIDQECSVCCKRPMVKVDDWEGNPKNVHDIMVDGKVAYLLDNIAEPVYILKVDLSDLTNLKIIEKLRIYCSPANSDPHLVGQWLEKENDRWVIIASSSGYVHMGGMGGPSQNLHFFSASGLNANKNSTDEPHVYDESDLYENSATIFKGPRPFSIIVKVFKDPRPLSITANKKKNGNIRIGFPYEADDIWIHRNTPDSPPWLLFQKEDSLFLGKGRIVKKTLEKKQYFRWRHTLVLEKGLLLDIGESEGINRMTIKKYKDFLLVTLDDTLRVFDVSCELRELFSQDLEEVANDFAVIGE